MSKGMSTTLVIIITAVVILVTALVLLTIFGTGITPVATLADAKAQCTLQGKSLCETTGALPPTWSLQTMRVGDTPMSCDEVCGGTSGVGGNDCPYIENQKVYKFLCG